MSWEWHLDSKQSCAFELNVIWFVGVFNDVVSQFLEKTWGPHTFCSPFFQVPNGFFGGTRYF